MPGQSDRGKSRVSHRPLGRRGFTNFGPVASARFGVLPALVAITAVTALAVPVPEADPGVTRERSTPGVSAAVSCNDAFASLRVELLSCIFKDDLSEDPADHGAANQGADIWGHVSPSCREYAIMGLRSGVVFVEVTDPRDPVIVGYIDGPSSVHRDIKTYQQYAYIVVDNVNLGLQVVDLSEIDDGIVTLVKTSNDRNFLKAHNIAIDTVSGYAYTVAGNIDDRGLTPWDLSDPANPVALPGWDERLLHDVLVVTYTEGNFAGRQIAYGFAEASGLKVIDVTDKDNMFTLATRTYPNVNYCHQGWLSEDRQYLFIDDEFDEDIFAGGPDTTTTYVFDVSNPGNPQYLTSFTNGIESTDHNLMTRGRFVFEANYVSGLRVFDTCDIQNVVEVGYFDTHPEVDEVSNYDGAWGVFTDFPSRIVIVSDRDRGLFVFDTSEAEAVPPPLPECQDEEITIPTTGDGCCPPGADANNDSDCDPVCGNDVCEADEHPVNCSADCPCAGNASCDDGDTCTFDICTAGACNNVETAFGDVAGDGGTCGPDQVVGLLDILGVLNAFQGTYSDGCERYNMDLANCAPDGIIDLSDILAILDAFQGTSTCCE